MTNTRRSVLLAISAGATALLAGCSAGDEEDPQPAGEHPGGEEQAGSASEGEDESEGEADEAPAEAEAEPAEPEMVPVPDGGPEGITEFPIPAGAEIMDMGAGMGNWMFVITDPDTETSIDFYRQLLPESGYTVTEDVPAQDGALTYDLVWEGPVFGAAIAQEALGGLSITLDKVSIV